ncbi:MAG: MFS transporter [Leucobacter sp.]
MTPSPETRRPWALMLAAVCLVAVNMRMTITGVGPLLEEIAADQGVSPAALGGLASVPLLAWGLVSPLAHWLSMRLGSERAVTWSLVALGLGTVWRSLPGGPAHLWLGTALIGAALAIGNVLLPAVIRRDFGSRIPLVMGIYTALLGGMGAISSGIVVPISHAGAPGAGPGWRIALLCTGILIPLAVVVWAVAMRGSRTDRTAPGTPAGTGPSDTNPVDTATAPTAPPPDRSHGRSAGRRIWRDPVAWTVAFYMGLQSTIFYMTATWLAPIETSQGRSPVEAGVDVMIFQLISIAGSLLLPLLYRGRMRRRLAAVIPVFTGGSFACLVLLPHTGTLLWLAIGGLGSGASLSLSLMFMAIRARRQEAASALSGMSQSVGYLIAATGPAAFGLMHGLSGGWIGPLALLLAVAAGQLVFGIAVGRDRYALEAR